MKQNSILLFLFFLSLFSCKPPSVPDEKKISAIVGQDTIYLDDVDERLKQQLYMQLSQVFQMRRIVTNKLIDEKVIELEAKQKHITSDELIGQYIKAHDTDADLQDYIAKNGLENGVNDLKKDLKQFDIHSEEGKKVLYESFRKNLRKKLIAELKLKYPSQTFLVPPPQPKINLADILVHYKGNLDSKVTVTFVSDFECDNCRHLFSKYDSLYNKYKNRVRFAFTHYSSYISLAAIASEAAAKQDKFWEMHDHIFKTNLNYRDTNEYIKLASTLHLNIPEFIADMKDSAIYESIKQNIQTVKEFGIMGTPTVIVNKRIVINSSQTIEIENTIDEEIKDDL